MKNLLLTIILVFCGCAKSNFISKEDINNSASHQLTVDDSNKRVFVWDFTEPKTYEYSFKLERTVTVAIPENAQFEPEGSGRH